MINIELIHSAWDGLISHKLRSVLTTLGVIFGVAAVIGMASIGEGARREALKQIELMGASNILIDESRPEEGEEHTASLDKNPYGLTMKDADAIQGIIEDAIAVVPIKIIERKVSAADKRAELNIVAAPPNLFNLYNLKLKSGRRLNWNDEDNYQRVCVLGWGAARELFPLENPLNKEIRVYKYVLTVVGVVSRRAVGGGKIEGVDLRDENMDVYVPLQTILKREPIITGNSELTRIVVKVAEPSLLGKYARLIENIIHRRHREVNDFRVIIPEELLRQHQATQRIFNIVMGTIASISLIVGGIGIMNIMLASVLERTREIGIRRAVGARQSDIARQFLTEAVLLSLSGGIVGVILGVMLAHVITMFAGWETAVSWWAILVAVGVSVGVGVIFGWLPARRAAKLDPITALRYE
ncbi:MAG: ABC transporter permease [Candidatus Hatepunaea meridiana]|nr:ABC transporter permease [Candidatus Hatepunaea meridiana]